MPKGEKSWKGNDAGLISLHRMVWRKKGKPNKCEVCGTETAKKYEWANLSGNYADVNDYKRMCTICHRKYDDHSKGYRGKMNIMAKLTDEQVRDIRRKEHPQKYYVDKYKMSVSQISDITRGLAWRHVA